MNLKWKKSKILGNNNNNNKTLQLSLQEQQRISEYKGNGKAHYV